MECFFFSLTFSISSLFFISIFSWCCFFITCISATSIPIEGILSLSHTHKKIGICLDLVLSWRIGQLIYRVLVKKKKSLCVLTVTVSLFLGDQVVDTWILYGQAARNTMGACPFQRKFYLSTPDCPVCPSYLATLRWRLEISPQTVFTAKEISPQTGLTSFRTNPQSREKTKGRFNLKKND